MFTFVYIIFFTSNNHTYECNLLFNNRQGSCSFWFRSKEGILQMCHASSPVACLPSTSGRISLYKGKDCVCHFLSSEWAYSQISHVYSVNRPQMTYHNMSIPNIIWCGNPVPCFIP